MSYFKKHDKHIQVKAKYHPHHSRKSCGGGYIQEGSMLGSEINRTILWFTKKICTATLKKFKFRLKSTLIYIKLRLNLHLDLHCLDKRTGQNVFHLFGCIFYSSIFHPTSTFTSGLDVLLLIITKHVQRTK